MGCSSSGSDCGGCPSQSSCGGGAPQQPQDLTAPLHELSSVKHVIGVVSGKGGVGKSSVTSLMAITMARKGYKVGILDADITGPSIPKIFGIKEKAYADEIGMYPVKSKGGIDVMSVNLLLENDTDPVLWRGPILGNVVKQFYSDVIWKDIDYLFVDMPPGTGDVAITVYQSLKLDGIIIVTSPQDLVSMIVEKAVKMADLMQVPIIGVVENYSYFHCPDNGKDYEIFGKSHIEEILQKYGLLLLGRLPIDPTIANLCDQGDIESIEKTNLEDVSLPQ
ncbi:MULTISPECIES: Mrp/NBP35 family ATP-binding protein [Veillonella]|uniref:Iron-sulfur cluster carrier protein n=2 Tax=Veillonella TaxID=29465 RepID=A0A239YV07_9FIRM|nr:MULTISPECIES: Mrp/NBP35 family ATP-binding protein [Veillonella]ETS93582.1 ParA/MinD ATPase-like protein [Veillonella sp. AS16]PQL18947.1 ATP-binding protein [Veillonella denticariosi JCM 15641]SNV62590.1 antiporter inner membrane protein [Veillonella rodentium]